MSQTKTTRLLRIAVVAHCLIAFTTQVASAQQRIFSDYFVRPAQGAIPGPYAPDQYGNPGVALQPIQPFDPYASTAPSLPPPVSGGSYAPAYPAPPDYLSAPPIAPPPVIPPATTAPPPMYGTNAAYNSGYYCKRGGLYGGFEAPILQARYGSFAISAFENDELVKVKATPSHDLAFSTRILGGYEWPGGLGFRARWWHFDDKVNGVGTVDGIDTATTAQLKNDAFDLEVTQSGRIYNWEFLVSGGVRFADIDSRIQSTLPSAEYIRTDSGFSGVGPVLGFGTRRSLQDWGGLTWVFNSRFSFLFGDHNVSNIGNVNGPVERETLATVQDVVPNWEIQVGAQWTRRFNYGASFYWGVFFEAQLWDWISPGDINSDLGFWGPTFAIGLTR